MSVLLGDNIIEWEAVMAVRSGNEKHASTRRSAVEAELQVEAQRLRTRLQPVVEEHDLYLEDVEVKVAGSHRTVHIVVDLPEDATGSVGLDVISAISSDLSAAMDSDPEDDDRPYSLEISSPGVSRPLTEPRHWRRNVGRMVEVKPATGDTVVGRLQDVTATGIRLIPQLPVKKGMKPKLGDPLALEFSKIRKGTVQVEFAHLEDEHHENSEGAEPDDSGAEHLA
ncbi:ribosome maturation factor RimP [Arthrobacter agilis]|jgi:ribosome maturation factor RimP|uniref:ribosome maturation factor RimP n=1 Tax=Arthrobacter agilis TaxID=37921 RepID=UPI00277EAAAB|nr:ribosome maturation factor RimP [Arthrobacter agilis]MDQ0734216.1 ribosome maturation factor RimP [Arthrobacter agilis]